jgi:hypothetical protein
MRGNVGLGEVISFGPEHPRDVVIDLLVDDGVPGRGHRKLAARPDLPVRRRCLRSARIYRTMCVVDMMTTDAAVPLQPRDP